MYIVLISFLFSNLSTLLFFHCNSKSTAVHHNGELSVDLTSLHVCFFLLDLFFAFLDYKNAISVLNDCFLINNASFVLFMANCYPSLHVARLLPPTPSAGLLCVCLSLVFLFHLGLVGRFLNGGKSLK